jgi:hypothetical protein
MSMRGERRAPFWRAVVVSMIVGLIVVVLLPAAGLAVVALQATDEPPRAPSQHDIDVLGPHAAPRTAALGSAAFDPFDAPGTLLARGTNTQPIGPYGLQTYVLEEVALPAGVPISVLGGRTDLTTVLRLSVLGGPFPVQSSPAVIWAGDVPLGKAALSHDVRRASILVTDRSLLRNGVVIGFSYGNSADLRTRLPEPLTLGSGSP